MNFSCKLGKKNFTTQSGQTQEYYVIEFELQDGSTLDVPIKADKARLLIFSYNLKNNK